MVTATTTANVEKPTLTAILIQGAYEYTDLAKLNADIIAAGDNEVERIVDLSAGVEITKISGKNVFAQNSTGGVLLYGTGLESKGMDANGGNAIVGKFVVKTKAFKGLPEITGVVSQSADAKIGAWSGQYPYFTRTIAQIEGEYAKYVNAKCKIVNVEVTKAFGQTKTGEIKDASGSLAIYNYSTDLTEDIPVGAKAEYAIVWPTVYNTHQLGFYKASQFKLTSCPGIVTVDKTKTIALGGDPVAIGATTNSTGALSYTSSDEAVVTVSDAGLLTAVAAGTATITVNVAADGKYLAGTAECAVTVTAGGAGGDESDVFFEVYTGEITEGCYIIYYDGKAMNTTTTSNRLQYAEVSPDGDQIKNPANEIQWFIEKSGDNWTLRNPVKNDYAVSTGTKNQATTASEPGEKGLWTITETAAGSKTYEIVNVFNSGKEINANLRNNGTYGFATYATSTGGALTLYKKK